MKFKKINGTLIEKYLWQGLTKLLAIYDADDNILMRFTYADSRLPVAMHSGGNTYYLAYDQVGSLRIVTDASGTVIKALDYDSFGNIIQDSNPSFDMPFGFAGGLYDPDTGLVRFGFREYSPEIGRWTAKDPLLFKAGDPDLYGYCFNDPINCFDPKGLDVYVYNYPSAGRNYGHVGLIVPNSDGTFTRYSHSQGADNPDAPWYELTVPLHDAIVDIKKMSSPCMPGANMVKVPTKHNDQIQKAIDDYIKADWPYNTVTNNCADFINDVLNAADDIDLSDKTKPNSYFNELVGKYGPYKCKP